MSSLVCEVATPESGALFFDPVAKPLRGFVNYQTMAEQSAFARAREFPRGIVGQRIELDVDERTARIVDGLNDPAWEPERRKLERKGLHPMETETFTNVDVSAWLWWLQRGIAAGCIRLISGRMPKQVSKPEKLLREERKAAAQSGDVEALRELVAQQGEQINRLVEAVTRMAGAKA